MKRPWLKWILVGGYLALAAAVAMHRYRTCDLTSDFDVFWRAGNRFLHGGPLYPSEAIDYTFLYPPFAAFVFQLLALFPQRLAGAGAAFVNMLLYPVAIWLTWHLLKGLLPNAHGQRWPFLAAVLLSFRFFQVNAHWIQINLIIFVLLLAGIAAGKRERWYAAAAAFVAATGIKLVPGIFVAWLLLRGPRRAVVAVGSVALAAILLPLLWRGPAQGWLDLTQYFDTFLAESLSGGGRFRYDNHNLATLAYSFFIPLNDPSGLGGPWLPGGAVAGAWLYRVAALGVGASWMGMVVMRRRALAEWSAYELAATFLAGLLLSGITWLAHLVSLLFVYAVLFSTPAQAYPPPRRVLRWFIIAVAMVGGVGPALVGRTMDSAIRAYHVVPVLLVVCYAATVVMAVRGRGRDVEPGAAGSDDGLSPAGASPQ